ncbi:low affinity immunoglobulin gamma Fc region receptor II-like [Astatotilapia calliptera]|uniref:low affinity immunoglobulin gamma Fc region receptor II-like n=1 Tax=Astatotilapia calliptera TaxID=8154 RepID=UPI000E3FCDC7|nr:low affinity immunoglobulin gamma Fc region receptor II-like [Astatotilapia calliptera]
MEVRELCIRLLMTVIILLCAHDWKVDAVSLRIVPNKSQFFEYESVSFYCEENFHGHVVFNIRGEVEYCRKTSEKTTAKTTDSKCTINPLYVSDSGEYWCGTAEGKRSNKINITVTAGFVILESPAVPVMEGEAVTLRCRNKLTLSDFMADFYKYGVHIRNNSTGSMTIRKVSKSDEGLYKCSILGVGESPESWLPVTGSAISVNFSASHLEIYLILRTMLTIMLMALLLLGLVHCGTTVSRWRLTIGGRGNEASYKLGPDWAVSLSYYFLFPVSCAFGALRGV